MQYPRQEDIIAYECRHAIYSEDKTEGSKDDMVTLKLIAHTKDGRKVPMVRKVKNYKRDFYVTKEKFRNHEMKKTAEDMSKLKHFTGYTDRELPFAVAKALGKHHRWGGVRQYADSPYLYGTDDTAATQIRRRYAEKYPDIGTPNSVCAVDIETNVTVPKNDPDFGKIYMVGATMKDRAIITIRKDFLEGVDDPIGKLLDGMATRMPEKVADRKIKLTIKLCDTSGECTVEAMKAIHEWNPDILSTWNMAFDVPIMIDSVIDIGLDPADVFSHPDVPPEFRVAEWIAGRDFKESASGKREALHWTKIWHTFNCTAGYYWIDSGGAYKTIRAAQGNLPSYALQAILNKELDIGKMKWEELDIPEDGLAWHVAMQKHHKIEYCLYNIFDCIALEFLDEKTLDLSNVLPGMVGISEYKKIPSQPKRIVDRLVSFYRKHNKVLASSPRKIREEIDDKSVTREGWITTLACELVDIEGAKLFIENPEHFTLLIEHLADLDVTGAYPVGQIVMNISRETERIAICRISGMDIEDRRSVGINMTAPQTNAIHISQVMFKYPRHKELLEQWDKKIAA